MAILQSWKRKILATTAVLAVLIVVAYIGGCSSSTLPPKPTRDQLAILQATHFGATVGVEAYKYPIYSESLANDLRATGLFNAVEPLWKIPKPDLVATIERPVHGTATIPFWTAVTFGIVPTTVEEEHGYVFSLRSAANPAESALVDYTFRGPSTLGWASFFLNFASDRSSGNPNDTPQFHKGLAIAVSSRRDQISGLIDSQKQPKTVLQK